MCGNKISYLETPVSRKLKKDFQIKKVPEPVLHKQTVSGMPMITKPSKISRFYCAPVKPSMQSLLPLHSSFMVPWATRRSSTLILGRKFRRFFPIRTSASVRSLPKWYTRRRAAFCTSPCSYYNLWDISVYPARIRVLLPMTPSCSSINLRIALTIYIHVSPP